MGTGPNRASATVAVVGSRSGVPLHKAKKKPYFCRVNGLFNLMRLRWEHAGRCCDTSLWRSIRAASRRSTLLPLVNKCQFDHAQSRARWIIDISAGFSTSSCPAGERLQW